MTTGKSPPPKQAGRLCLYLQRFYFLLKPGGAAHESAPRQAFCIRAGLSVEDLPTMYRGRPLPKLQRQLDCTQTCLQHLRGEFTPTKAAPDQNQAAKAAPASTQGTAAAALAERLLLSSTHSFLHHLPPRERAGRGDGHFPLWPSPTPPQPRGKCAGQGQLAKGLDLDLWSIRWTFALST